jgi:hypothetical protein
VARASILSPSAENPSTPLSHLRELRPNDSRVALRLVSIKVGDATKERVMVSLVLRVVAFCFFIPFTMKFTRFSYLAALLLPSLVAAQLSGSLGPSTTKAAKSPTNVCSSTTVVWQARPQMSDRQLRLLLLLANLAEQAHCPLEEMGGDIERCGVTDTSSLCSTWRLWYVNLGYPELRNGLGSPTSCYYLPCGVLMFV